MSQVAFVVDLDRCIGCKGCQVSCKMANNVALGSVRNAVKQVGPIGVYPNTLMYFLPSMCQQCENPACAEVCPTGATYKREEDGVVVIDQNVCIGCQTCHSACPYQVNTFNEELRVMDKCNICLQKREKGDLPHCVKNCCGKALFVGDLQDPESEVSKLLAETDPKYIHSLRDEGNHPSVRYILRKYEWQDVLPQECHDTRRGNKK